MPDSYALGHRKRLKEEYIASGGKVTDRALLELILYYSIRRRDTKPLAAALLSRFDGEPERLFCSDKETLRAIDGVGDATAELLTLFGEIAVKKELYPGKSETALHYFLPEVKAYAAQYFENETGEKCDLLLFDNNLHRVACNSLDKTESKETLTRLAATALSAKKNIAFTLCLCRHAGESYLPEEAECAFVQRLARAMGDHGLTLLDCVIVSDEGSLSLVSDIRYCRLFDE